MVRLLLVDDDPKLVDPLTKVLNSDGYAVAHIGNGLTAIEKIKVDPPDLMLLDVNLPGIDGFKVCETLRKQGFDFPIVMISANFESSDVVHGLEIGADDYVTKPFEKSELLARLRAVARRTLNNDVTSISSGRIKIDRKSHSCWVDDEEVELTRIEFLLLDYLMQNQGRALKRQLIIREIWATSWLGPTKNLDMHISTLRRKLGPGASQLKTVRGVGFRLDAS